MIEVYGQPGWQPNSSVHTANNRGQDTRKEAPVPGGVDTGWHVCHLHWEKNILQFSTDNKVYLTVRPSDLPNWPFNRAAFMILNLAVGGEGGGPVPANFSSAQMVIDYVRVW
jgi:beta-glucanase (GH16 family)